MKRLYLDDRRLPAESVAAYGRFYTEEFDIVRNIEDFKVEVSMNMPDLISFDHDLEYAHYKGDYSDYRTGYDCLLWLIDYCGENNIPLPAIRLHTMSTTGMYRMRDLLSISDKLLKF
jgi:hypothetical protein